MTEDLDHDGTTRLQAPGNLDELVTIKLHSCHSTWYFQPVKMRFRREPKGISFFGVSTGWRSYYGLHFDDTLDRFTVYLDREGSRRLSSPFHPFGSDVCATCATQDAGQDAHHDTQREAETTPWKPRTRDVIARPARPFARLSPVPPRVARSRALHVPTAVHGVVPTRR